MMENTTKQLNGIHGFGQPIFDRNFRKKYIILHVTFCSLYDHSPSPFKVWISVQQKWMYLEAIFMGGDVAKQLPQEAKRFEQIDKTFRKVGGLADMYCYR